MTTTAYHEREAAALRRELVEKFGDAALHHLWTFAGWDDWKAEGDRMVSPSGKRKLKRETYERLKGAAKKAAPGRAVTDVTKVTGARTRAEGPLPPPPRSAEPAPITDEGAAALRGRLKELGVPVASVTRTVTPAVPPPAPMPSRGERTAAAVGKAVGGFGGAVAGGLAGSAAGPLGTLVGAGLGALGGYHMGKRAAAGVDADEADNVGRSVRFSPNPDGTVTTTVRNRRGAVLSQETGHPEEEPSPTPAETRHDDAAEKRDTARFGARAAKILRGAGRALKWLLLTGIPKGALIAGNAVLGGAAGGAVGGPLGALVGAGVGAMGGAGMAGIRTIPNRRELKRAIGGAIKYGGRAIGLGSGVALGSTLGAFGAGKGAAVGGAAGGVPGAVLGAGVGGAGGMIAGATAGGMAYENIRDGSDVAAKEARLSLAKPGARARWERADAARKAKRDADVAAVYGRGHGFAEADPLAGFPPAAVALLRVRLAQAARRMGRPVAPVPDAVIRKALELAAKEAGADTMAESPLRRAGRAAERLSRVRP